MDMQAQKEKTPKLTLSITEAANALGVAPVTVRRLLASGRLLGTRTSGDVGRWLITRDTLERFLTEKSIALRSIAP
jgi:excisionase family DNA binding protein